MKNEITDIFDKITPPMSDEELLKAVLGKAELSMEKKKGFMRKAVAIPCAAALALGVTAVSVGAVYQWDLSRAFGEIFSGQWADPESAPFDINDIDFEGMGKELDIRFEGDGYALNVLGAIADNYSAYILYEVAFDEELSGRYTHITPHINMDQYDWQFKTLMIAGAEDETHKGYFMINSDTPISGETLSFVLSGIEVYTDNESYTTLPCDGAVEITFDFGTANTLEKEVGEYLTLGNTKMTLDNIKLGAFVLTVQFSGYPGNGVGTVASALDNDYGHSPAFALKMKNGEEKTISFSGYSCAGASRETSVTFDLAYPINVDEVAAITIGDLTVEF